MTTPVGNITRGTTAPNRLRRCDRWLIHMECSRLSSLEHAIVIDLGYGAYPVTTRELADRLHNSVGDDIEVVGLEIDPQRVQQAIPFEQPHLRFRRGGFELAGMHAHVVRAFNVLRQYDESSVQRSWQEMYSHLAPGGLIIDGTCDEVGRRSAWLAIRKTADAVAAPQSLTLSTQLASLGKPSDLAERLPKALIHHNLPGQPVHAFLQAFDRAWAINAPHGTFGARQRWIAAVDLLVQQGTPVIGDRKRWSLGEVTVPWSLVAPTV
ncbi:MAG: class I SAM-dependent methyltransferase [Candidatus Nanopelagicales bacterium]